MAGDNSPPKTSNDVVEIQKAITGVTQEVSERMKGFVGAITQHFEERIRACNEGNEHLLRTQVSAALTTYAENTPTAKAVINALDLAHDSVAEKNEASKTLGTQATLVTGESASHKQAKALDDTLNKVATETYTLTAKAEAKESEELKIKNTGPANPRDTPTFKP